MAAPLPASNATWGRRCDTTSGEEGGARLHVEFAQPVGATQVDEVGTISSTCWPSDKAWDAQKGSLSSSYSRGIPLCRGEEEFAHPVFPVLG